MKKWGIFLLIIYFCPKLLAIPLSLVDILLDGAFGRIGGFIGVLLYFLILAIIVAAPIYYLLWYDKNQRDKKNNQTKQIIRNAVMSIPLGADFNTVSSMFDNMKAVYPPELDSDELLSDGVRRKTYVWWLDWEVTNPNNGQVQNAYFMIAFDNDKFVMKNEYGLFD